MRAAVSTESALGPRGPLGLPLSERGFPLLVASRCAASVCKAYACYVKIRWDPDASTHG